MACEKVDHEASLLLLFAGVLVLEGNARGMSLMFYAWLPQIPLLNTALFAYELTGGIALRLLIDLASIAPDWQLALGSRFAIGLVPGSSQTILGINAVACFFAAFAWMNRDAVDATTTFDSTDTRKPG